MATTSAISTPPRGVTYTRAFDKSGLTDTSETVTEMPSNSGTYTSPRIKACDSI